MLAAQPLRLKLAHINDTHSHFEPTRLPLQLNQQPPFTVQTGGYARIQAQLLKAKQQAEQHQQAFLFLHGGDSFQGSLYFREFQGKANGDLLSMLQPDAMVLGNHEVDAGNAKIRQFLDLMQCPLLAGNLDLHQEPNSELALNNHPLLYDYQAESQSAKVLIKTFGEHQVALIGITIEQMANVARPDQGTHFVSAQQTCQNTIDLLHQQGIYHIIVLSHLGFDGDQALAQAVQGISLIVGGHSHTLQGEFQDLGLPCQPYPVIINHTPIVHASKYAEVIGLADIEFDQQGKVTQINGSNYLMIDAHLRQTNGQPLPTPNYQQALAYLQQHPCVFDDSADDSVQFRIASKYRPRIDHLAQHIVTHVPQPLIHSRLPSQALPHGSELAPWVSRGMYQQSKLLDKDIDFVIHNAGGVRNSLAQGELSLATIYGSILPFDIPLVKYLIQGKYIYQTIESSIDAATNNGIIGTGTGSFPYPYGLRYQYQANRPSGQRLVMLEVMQNKQWRPVRLEEYYLGVSSAFTALGKEGYHPLLKRESLVIFDQLTLPSSFVGFVEDNRVWQSPLPPNVIYQK